MGEWRPITVSVSGGADSIAACHFLMRGGWNVTVFHFNHLLRPQNHQMEDAVRRFCSDFNLPLVVANADEFPLFPSKLGVEAAARQARFAAIAKNVRSPLVMAHHLDDCIESHLMSSLHGGTRSPVIPPISEIDQFTILRPFLLARKSDLRRYAEENHLSTFIIEDETNTDVAIRRNWIRHVLIPTIELSYKGLPKVVRKKVLQEYAAFETKYNVSSQRSYS